MKKLSQIASIFFLLLISLLTQETKAWHIRWFWSWPWKPNLDNSPQPDMSKYKYFEDYDDPNYCTEC